MKRILALAAAALLSVSAVASVSAKYPDAAKGDSFTVPKASASVKIDGELDKSYKEVFNVKASDCYGMDHKVDRNGLSPNEDDTNKEDYDKMGAVGYMTWDANALYFYVIQNDPNPVFASTLDYANRAKGMGLEFSFNKSASDKTFVIMDKTGKVLATTADGRAQTMVVCGGKILGNDQYAFEMAIPWKLYCDGYTPTVGNKDISFGYTMCSRDVGSLNQRLIGFGGTMYREANKTGIPLIIADVPAPETTKAVTTAAATKTPAVKPSSPATFDASVIIAAAAAVSAAGVVVSKKRK